MARPLRFWKMTGAGNDFIVLDGRRGLPRPPSELARMLCPRGVAVGADGLIAVTDVERRRVALEFFNADGSPAGFCGNGARCAARFAWDRGLARGPCAIAFPALTVRARLIGEQVEIVAPRPDVLPDRIAVRLADGPALVGRRIRCGVEHVVFAEPQPAPELEAFAAAVFAAHPELARCVNVTLVRRRAPDALDVRTLERGVGLTLACGSAALAAAAFVESPPGAGGAVTVTPPSGIPLRVTLNAESALMVGEARVVFYGEIPAELLRPR